MLADIKTRQLFCTSFAEDWWYHETMHWT